jgi:hypothetical protein
MPIGELFDLEKLAEYCKKEKRWSFFVTSEVCNVPGGVAEYPGDILRSQSKLLISGFRPTPHLQWKIFAVLQFILTAALNPLIGFPILS